MSPFARIAAGRRVVAALDIHPREVVRRHRHPRVDRQRLLIALARQVRLLQRLEDDAGECVCLPCGRGTGPSVIMKTYASGFRREREWLAQWRRAGAALEQVRSDDLANLSHAEALRAAETLLALSGSTPLPADRALWSGLIELQRQLHRGRS
jgi:hypothetical protein